MKAYLLLFAACMMLSSPLLYAEEEWELEIEFKDADGNRSKRSLELEGLELEFKIEERTRKRQNDVPEGAEKPKNGRYKHKLSEEEAAEIIKILKSSMTAHITNLKKDEKEFKNKDGYADIEIKYESSEGNVELDIEFKAMEDETHKALFGLIQSYYQKSIDGGNL